MIDWLAVALLGGLVGLDSTSFPQVMISRPLIAGALTGALFGRPVEGIVLGFMLEAFSLIILPIGAARYPETGTAAVAAVAGYVAAGPVGLDPAYLALALAFALAWEGLSGQSVVLLRQANGRLLTRHGGVTARQLERLHLTAMGLDFLRGAAVSAGGGLLAFGLLRLAGPLWGLSAAWTVPALALLVSGMLGTAVVLFGGWKARRVALVSGVLAGLLAAVVLR